MAPHDHHHGHDHGHSHSHGRAHSHGPTTPHPAQAAPWSILRMPAVARLGVAITVSAMLWAAVLLAMR
jgi:ABC-type Zn2+ transport system substrate-binding protein/surface adhesin